MTPEGLIVRSSDFDPKETMERLVSAITRRAAAVLARVDHAAAASAVGLALRPTEVVIFGNPRAGTPLMQAAQTMGIDLPLRALVWRDEGGRTWLGYNDPAWLARRHGAEAGHELSLRAMTDFLVAVAQEATKREAP
jgi:uncharacterized protein (DUF302 family)